MEEKPKVVVSRTRQAVSTAKEFNFAESDIRAGKDSVASYRASAWSAFKKLSLPDTTLEAWRRTDIHNLPADKFKFAAEGAFNDLPPVRAQRPLAPEQQVVIGGYGRVGHTIAVLLKASGVAFIVFDTDPKRVAQGRADGHPVLYGDISDPELLSAIHVDRASLVVITVDSSATALRAVSILRSTCPQVPIVVRARDLETSSRLLDAGATHAYPEAIEASLRLGATALRILRIPTDDIDLVVQEVRDWDYRPVIEEERDNRPAAERGP